MRQPEARRVRLRDPLPPTGTALPAGTCRLGEAMSLRLLLPVLLLGAGCSRVSVRAVEPVTVSIPAAPAPTAEPEEAAAPAHPAAKRKVTGVWREEFATRRGCSDSVTISGTPDALTIQGEDCNDHKDYVFDDVKYDGTTLSLQMSVPETGVVVRYVLRWLPDGSLGGEATVASTDTFKVRWIAQR
jgi:hypothetical protein